MWKHISICHQKIIFMAQTLLIELRGYCMIKNEILTQDILSNNKYQTATTQIKAKDNPEDISRQIEKVFLNELLKNIFEHTEFGKNKAISPFVPFFTAEMSDAFSQKGIGVGEFLTRTDSLKLQKSKEIKSKSDYKFQLNEIEELNPVKNEEKNTSYRENISSLKDKDKKFNLTLPAEGQISSFFGMRIDPFIGKLRQHNGIDIALKEGSKVKAAASGKVAFVGEMMGFGKVVVLDHEDGYSSIYGHNSKNLVSKGEMVKVGQVIALSGSTGRATGPHLHFELRKEGEAINPLELIG